jgi:capsular exopolysaccharide synthesis family protein
MTPDASIAAYPEMTLRDYVRVLFRNKAVIVTVMLTVLAVAFIGLKWMTPIYEAQVKVLISAEKQVESPYYREILGPNNTEMVLTQSEIVRSHPILERTVKALRLYDRPIDYERQFASPLKHALIDFKAERTRRKLAGRSPDQQRMSLFRLAVADLKDRVTVEPIRDANLFTISVREFSPVGAAITANTVSRSYLIFDLEQQLAELRLKYGEKHQAVQQLTDNIRRMSESLGGGPVPDVEAIGPASVKIMEQASIPMGPVGPPKAPLLALAGAMSFFLGVILAFLFEYLDQTVKSPTDVERYLKVPYLASVPKRSFWNRSLITNVSAGNAYAEAYRALSDQLYLQLKERNASSLLVTGPVPQEGATTTIANLGLFFSSRAGQDVLLIDANLRRPTLHRYFQKPQGAGLAELLEGREPWESALVQVAPNLWILPAGSTNLNPLTLFDSPRLTSILEQAKARFKMVLIDCADTRRYADSTILARLVDGVVLVVADGKTRRQVLQSALEPLAHLQAKLLGVVLNARRFVIPRVIYEWV